MNIGNLNANQPEQAPMTSRSHGGTRAAPRQAGKQSDFGEQLTRERGITSGRVRDVLAQRPAQSRRPQGQSRSPESSHARMTPQSEMSGGQQTGAKSSTQHLGQEDYLKLMVAQFTHQDPTKPMKNGEFLGQLAQFGTVSGIKKLQKSFAKLAESLHSNEALRAAALVGHSVTVNRSSAKLGAHGSLSGAVDVPSTGGDIKLIITNQAGQRIQSLDLGQQSSGLADFSWNGRTAKGNRAPPGTYTVRAQLQGSGKARALPTLMHGKINSVQLNDNGHVKLSVAGLGDIKLTDVQQISG